MGRAKRYSIVIYGTSVTIVNNKCGLFRKQNLKKQSIIKISKKKFSKLYLRQERQIRNQPRINFGGFRCNLQLNPRRPPLDCIGFDFHDY